LPALITKIEGEGIIHLRHPGNFGNLINALCSFDASIDFLQAHEIGMLRVNHAGNARQIKFLVHADADVNVIGHDTNNVRVCGGRN